jgi:hypothetical protein
MQMFTAQGRGLLLCSRQVASNPRLRPMPASGESWVYPTALIAGNGVAPTLLAHEEEFIPQSTRPQQEVLEREFAPLLGRNHHDRPH